MDPWTSPEPARLKRGELGLVLVIRFAILGPARPVSFLRGSGLVPPNLGPARPMPTPIWISYGSPISSYNVLVFHSIYQKNLPFYFHTVVMYSLFAWPWWMKKNSKSNWEKLFIYKSFKMSSVKIKVKKIINNFVKVWRANEETCQFQSMVYYIKHHCGIWYLILRST